MFTSNSPRHNYFLILDKNLRKNNKKNTAPVISTASIAIIDTLDMIIQHE
jgi:hypothetical protein